MLELSANSIAISGGVSGFKVSDTRRPAPSLRAKSVSLARPPALQLQQDHRHSSGDLQHHRKTFPDDFDIDSDPEDEEEEEGEQLCARSKAMNKLTNRGEEDGDEDPADADVCGLSQSGSPAPTLSKPTSPSHALFLSGGSSPSTSTLSLPPMKVAPLAFRSDLCRVTQETAAKQARTEAHEQWVDKLDSERDAWGKVVWSKKQQALSLVMLVVEGHLYQKRQKALACLRNSSCTTQAAALRKKKIHIKPLPAGDKTEAAEARSYRKQLDLSQQQVLAMILHDLFVLVDNKKGIDRFPTCKEQIVSMALWE